MCEGIRAELAPAGHILGAAMVSVTGGGTSITFSGDLGRPHDPITVAPANLRQVPMVIIAASGMATGGRVLHHLRAFASEPRNTILFAGYQAGGTRGAAMVAGADSIKIFDQYVRVRAQVTRVPRAARQRGRGGPAAAEAG